MKFFPDIANLDESRTGGSWGIARWRQAIDMPFNHPPTGKGLERFLKAGRKTFREEPAVR